MHLVGGTSSLVEGDRSTAVRILQLGTGLLQLGAHPHVLNMNNAFIPSAIRSRSIRTCTACC